MNWLHLKRLSVVQVGTFLALMMMVMTPHFSARLPSALLGILGGWFLWRHRANLFADIAVQRLTAIFALLWLPMLLSVPASYDWRHSAIVVAAIPVYFLAGLVLIHALRADPQRLWLAKWLTILVLIWIADGLVQYLLGSDLLGYPLTRDGRLTGFFRGNLGLSTAVAILLPIPVWYVMSRSRLALLAVFVCAGVVAVLVGTRNALVMMMVVAAGTALRLPRRYWPALAVTALVLAAASSLSPALQERLHRSVNAETATFENIDHILSGRLTIWETAGRMVVDRPLTGVGIGSFAAAYDDYSTRADDPFRTGGSFGSPFQAHHIYLSIAAETGVLGLLASIAAFVLCLKWYYAALPPRREQAWPYAFSLFIAMFPLSVEYTVFKHWFFPIPLLMLCGMLAAISDETPAPPALMER